MNLSAPRPLLVPPPSRRVHISSVTLEHLNGSYKVEPGDGQSRDSYLKEHGVVTFLVVNPKVRRAPGFSLISPCQCRISDDSPACFGRVLSWMMMQCERIFSTADLEAFQWAGQV